MAKGILGTKLGMISIWDASGKRIAVTAIEAGPCPVTQVKTPEKEGYSAVQIGFNPVKSSTLSKAERNHQSLLLESGYTLPTTSVKSGRNKVAHAATTHLAELTEIRDYPEDVTIGSLITTAIFAEGEVVQVRGTSKGRGFQGNVKRNGFAGGPASHGSRFHRVSGSVGAGTTPGHVNKGMKMPGRMGGESSTAKNLEIVKIVPEENLILIKGSVPGNNGGTVLLYKK